MSLFKTAAVFTDFHVGLKQNSQVHHEDCRRYIDWFIKESVARNAETCIFLGDWSHQRAAINVTSMNVSIELLKKLNSSFDAIYFITGNHDLYFRDKRDLNSIEYARDLSNFIMIDNIYILDEVSFIPWLVGDEWKKLSDIDTKYMFGHLELPRFKMNAMLELSEASVDIRQEYLQSPEYVFSGHFHRRQYNNNIHYIGNAFPHNYADVDDLDRGAMFLTWDQPPIYVNWSACPKYRAMKLSELLDSHEDVLDEYTYARIYLDIDISYEEATFIKNNFIEQYNVRELQLLSIREESNNFDQGEILFESVDQIVISELKNVDSTSIDKNKLIDIYKGLESN